ncbi:MAG: SusC/RagA family TonB-linked outer membrane protein, partial [Marinilabiliaceae bacterium]
PGEEDPRIQIRGQSTWNNSEPLVLVDGIERPLSSVDINSVENISVLKDASATAVYGVKGANGVILVTTKRGQEGKASIDVEAESTLKAPSKLPNKMDSYDAIKTRNRVIEREVAYEPSSWDDYTPHEILEKYRNPANLEERERYPNVDWQDALFKDYAMSHNASLNISGGTPFVKYFTSADFQHEGDIFEEWDNNRGYTAKFGFNRLNVRSNLDFQLTNTTVLKTNLAGSYGVRETPWGFSGGDYSYWQSAYGVAPDLFPPKYSDGVWGYYPPDEEGGKNSARVLALGGSMDRTTTRLNTDFTLEQDLSMILEGLSAEGKISWDNTFIETERGINDTYNDPQRKWIDPETGEAQYRETYDASRFDFQEGVEWSTQGGSMENGATYRKLFYQMQLDYNVEIDNHNVSAMGLFSRDQEATGSEIPRYREDWVFRTTYDYNNKYFFEYNGAYNGSEKFSKENRFAFFSSGAIGWMISEEDFMQGLGFLDMLKLRGSYGEIGDDNIGDRWLYMTQWAYGGGGNGSQAYMGNDSYQRSPYTWYMEESVGNRDVHWETVRKANAGADFAFFDGLIAGAIDFFQDERYDILIDGGDRAIPFYYGTEPPVANLGEVRTQGYELELRLNKTFPNDLRLWSNINITHAEDEVLDADSPELLPDYQKDEGKPIGQTYSYVDHGYYNNWDELYGSTPQNTNDAQKMPGNYNLIDFNGDGVIDSYDNIPYGFPERPQNTYSTTVGVDWKGFSGFVQFYGVSNVTRQVVFESFAGNHNTVYDEGTFWSGEDMDGDVPLPRVYTDADGSSSGTRYMFDGSYLRLKNAEIAYTFDSKQGLLDRLGFQNLRIYLNGNNLMVWTDMPDDREANFAGTGWASQGAYPTVKRYNLGINVSF